MVAPEAVPTRVHRQHPDRLSTTGASRPGAHAIRLTAESLEILGPCSQYLMRRLRSPVRREGPEYRCIGLLGALQVGQPQKKSVRNFVGVKKDEAVD